MNQEKSVYAYFGIIIAVVTGFMAYLFFSYVQVAVFEPVNVEVPQQPSTPTPAPQPIDPVELSEEGALTVRWQAPEAIEVPGNWQLDADWGDGLQDVGTFYFYNVGVVTVGEYANANVLLAEWEAMGPQFVKPEFRFLKVGPQLILLTQHSDDYTYIIDPSAVTINTDLRLPGFLLPESFTEPVSGETMKRDPEARYWFEMTALEPAFSHPGIGQLYTNKASSEFIADVPYINQLNGFLARLPDGRVAAYEASYGFMGADGIPQIRFSDGTDNAVAYQFVDVGSCGKTNYAAVVAADEEASLSLVDFGRTSDGRAIYINSGETESGLLSMYEQMFVEEGQQKMAFDDFLKLYPYLYFRDGFERLIRLTNATILPAAECGKPVIYLYPESVQDVSVQVAPYGGFSYTDPAYNGGWQVIAHPDGRVVNKADGKTYPYLFWEGNGGIMKTDTNRGFVVAQVDVEPFLADSLAKLGFIDQEIADFIDFWLPRMQSAPYYFITFYGRDTMDALAPLNVQPTPDTIIRVLMDYRELDAPVEVEEYPLFAPKRTGFTVTEWGGVLR